MKDRNQLIVTPTKDPKTMWNIIRAPGVLFLIIVTITFCLFQSYRDRSKWQDTADTLQNIVNIAIEQNELITQLIKMNEKTQRLHGENDVPTIFAITPTFARPVQKAELTRLSQTFLHIPNFHWIVVEDSSTKTKLVMNFLKESGLIYTHLNTVTPTNYKLGIHDPHWIKPRGAAQRNAALEWIRRNLNFTINGIVYFADDDNAYSIKLFKEMEKINVVGVWPVGLVGGLMVERPICDNTTKKIVGFNAVWKPDRPFPLDMASFAINLRIILEHKDAYFSYEAKSGYQETMLLQQMITRDQLEPLADCCSKVYVWHTRTEAPQLRDEQKLIKKGMRSDLNIEV